MRGERAASGGFVGLRVTQDVGKKSSANGDARLHSPRHNDPRSLTRHAEAATPHPQPAGSIIELESALVHEGKRADYLSGNGDVFLHVACRITINGGNFGCLAANSEE